MLDSDIIWQLTHKLETNADYNTLYDGSKKFNNLKSASHSNKDSILPEDNSTIHAIGIKSTGMSDNIVKDVDDNKS